jgi:DNA polymerase III epsilon subunit-like protein
MARIEVDIEEKVLENDKGHEVDGIQATCSRCGHSVEVFGTEEASVKRGCAMLRDECPLGERNFYVGVVPEQRKVFVRSSKKPSVKQAPQVQWTPQVQQTPQPLIPPPAWLTGDQPMYLFFDTETTGVPAGADNVHMVQLAWLLTDDTGEVRAQADFIVRPDGFVIPDEVAKIHGITQARAMTEGRPLDSVMLPFIAALRFPVRLVGHNINFDLLIARKELTDRLGWEDETYGKETLCTMRASTDLCMIPRQGGGWKFPKLSELYRKLFSCDFENVHNARADIEATAKCFWELRRMGRI